MRTFVRNPVKFHRLLPDVSAEVVVGDVLNPDNVRRAVAGVGYPGSATTLSGYRRKSSLASCELRF